MLMQTTYLYGMDMHDAGFGRILNLSSMAAFSAGPYMSIYYVTKAFVLSFSQAVNVELCESGVMETGRSSIVYYSAATKIMNIGSHLIPHLVANASAAIINGRG